MGKYLLPDGETLVTNLKCAVVSYPDDPRYRRALWGAISQLTKYWMWEPDGDGGEWDAADSWDEAYNQTLENFDMLDQILAAADAIDQNTDEIEALLQALQTLTSAGAPCCDNLAPVAETHPYDDSVYPDTPPATWGDGEPIADASDWQQLTCGAAHAYVDYLKEGADQLHMVIQAGAVVVGTIAGLLGFLSGVGIILPVAYGTAAAIVSGIVALTNQVVFGDVADDLESARQSIVCAIVDGSPDALANAVENAVDPDAWNALYRWVDYATARNIILEGSHGEEYLGVNRRTDCECEDFTVRLVDDTNNVVITAAGDLVRGVWYDIPKHVLTQGGGEFVRAFFRWDNTDDTPADVSMEVRLVDFCNGPQTNDPYFNNFRINNVADTELVNDWPALPSSSFEGTAHLGVVTTSTDSDCTDWQMQVRLV